MDITSVHVFISTNRFNSFGELREYIDETYTEDGDGIPSQFMIETGLNGYEPMCIEAILSNSGHPARLDELLRDSSYADQWLPQLDRDKTADAAICVFSPNQLTTPASASIEYLGCLAYMVKPI
ncbi:hypothetical protein GCM10007907_12830 [Chitinimonas prasina]|uniref:Uncharacterized protein n=1 Tax=Chitinimonas prasina TaxID=1434937 RepID=A0ABQ5YDD9_9NEIS|nr:immunity 22 family protein [Chitinimonas prasina]GLR12493.1 hypothetical protein GCM10007907_12830 [Chitinimonas prasina]